MYIVLLSNHEWWAAFDESTAQYFAKQDSKFGGNKPRILKCVGPNQWKEVNVKENK